MQTNIDPAFSNNPECQQQVEEAESILRSCVHCGFCNATCPTYQLLNDERDGPRGRIYLIKQFLESGHATERTRLHLDRCLSCRSCETTCPSGVRYGRLLDIGRHLLEQQLPRSSGQQAKRWLLRQLIPYPQRFAMLLKLGRLFSPLMPTKLQQKIPPLQTELATTTTKQQSRTMLVLGGCVQKAATPNTNQALTRVLQRLGVSLREASEAGCCGALSYHLSANDEALAFARRNIDAWWPAIETGAEAVVISASGCGSMVKEYGHLLQDDPAYRDKAARVSALAKDVSEILATEDLTPLQGKSSAGKTSFHCPCSLQHGQQLGGLVEQIFKDVGIELTIPKDSHICCGSAGTYSLLQPELSEQLLDNKVAALTAQQPSQIVTANVGCQLHLASKTNVPVQHWIELLDPER
ncbi:MAG: glycolate oxidase subunit GlcF [Motiliproteus sp.]